MRLKVALSASCLCGAMLTAGVLLGCATHRVADPLGEVLAPPVVFGRAVTFLMEEPGRMYRPVVRFFEVENLATGERFNVAVDSDDKTFVVPLPAAEYELIRVQISEGPFMSMADTRGRFRVEGDRLTYLGTWRFGIDSPRYGRMMVLSLIRDEQEQSNALAHVARHYPLLKEQPVAVAIPEPSEVTTRLYEVMPYPRYPRYFRRHLW